MPPYQVNLTYFKQNGKYYSEGTYETQEFELWQIWTQVKAWLRERKLPGLMRGHSNFIVYIDVPEHPHRHPYLIITEE